MKYKFVEVVDQALLSATDAAWRAQIAANPTNNNAPFYDARLAHFQATATGNNFGADGKGRLCAVREVADPQVERAPGVSPADALIVVSYVPAQHLKMLDVTVCPNLNAANSEPDFAALAWISATAIMGCLRLTYQAYPCDELKVYANWPLDKQFLSAITTVMVGDPVFGAMFTVSSHGNWVVLTKKAPAPAAGPKTPSPSGT